MSGDTWYTYIGSDNIDPTAVTYSKQAPKAGETVTVSVTPRSSTYGGTISYRYSYSTDGGATWTNAGGKTTATSQTITIPEGAIQFQARVQASDDMGFTSADYVTGENMSLNTVGAYVGAGDKARRVGKLYIGIDGKARRVLKGYVGVDGKARLFLDVPIDAAGLDVVGTAITGSSQTGKGVD